MKKEEKKNWNRLQERLSRADIKRGRLLIGLDFDGTIADIVDAPHKASLTAQTRRLLTLLRRRPDTLVAILSGRCLDDLEGLVGLRGIYCAGNHGLEIHGPKMRWTHPKAEKVGIWIRRALKNDLQEFPGILIEHKRLGLAVHYRAVSRRHLSRLKKLVKNRFFGLKGKFRMIGGKKIFDLRPNVPWDKGSALEMIQKTLPGKWKTVFIGDDATDEEAFQTLGSRALTIRIGRVERSAAQYIIARRQTVDRLLQLFAERPGFGYTLQ